MINKDKLLEAIVKREYGFYYDDRTPKFSRPEVNCSDEICPGSHDRTQKIRSLINKKIKADENFYPKWCDTIRELHDLMRDEHMSLTDCSEAEANQWLDAFVDFNHLKKHVIDKDTYYSVDPVIGYKYGDNKI